MGRRILLAAGGTGGHMFPAQALAETLKAEGWEIALITDERGRKHAGHIPADPVLDVKAATLSPRRPVKAAFGVIKLMQGTTQAWSFMRDWKPDVVVGFGGYPSFPALQAAQRLRVPYVLHEQNAVLGRVNRLFAQKAHGLASGFETVTQCPEGAVHIYTGNPLRGQIIKAIPKTYSAPKRMINLLIVGGSLGAKLISETVPEAIADLPENMRKRLHVVQQTRSEHLEATRKTYAAAGVKALCEPFFDDIETHLAKAHYVIGRAGASSVSEIAVMGKPSLLVPLGIAMDDHQTANAQTLSRHNAADILPESDFTAKSVKTLLERRLSDSIWLENAAKAARKTGRTDAAHHLATCVKQAAGLP